MQLVSLLLWHKMVALLGLRPSDRGQASRRKFKFQRFKKILYSAACDSRATYQEKCALLIKV